MKKLPKLCCTRYAFYFNSGWEAIWYPKEPSKTRGGFNVTIKHHHENGGDSVSYNYPGPPSSRSSLHLIKIAIKEKAFLNQN